LNWARSEIASQKKKTNISWLYSREKEKFGPNLPSAAILKATTNSLFVHISEISMKKKEYLGLKYANIENFEWNVSFAAKKTHQLAVQ
jgi:hypothetical protein